MDVVLRTLSLLLLLAISSTLMAAPSCIKAPTTSCLMELAAADMNAIAETERERWQRLYDSLLIDEVLHVFNQGDIEGVWRSLDKIKSEQARTQAVESIIGQLVQSADERLLQFVWEMESDVSRLYLMLNVLDELLKNGHRLLAEKVYEDAQFVFRRMSSDELTDRIYNKMISAAKKFDDRLLLSSLANDYQKRMAGKVDPSLLLRSGAYAKAVEAANTTLQGTNLSARIQIIAQSWLNNRGEQELLRSVDSSRDELFRAGAMYVLGRHARNELKEPLLAEEYLSKAEHYTASIESIPVRDELYDDIGRQYRQLAKNDDLDMDDRILALAKKIDDWEKSIGLQFELLGFHVETKDFARAEAIVRRENRPHLSAVYHYILAESSRESGDTTTALMEIHAAQRFMRETDNKELSYELTYEVGNFLHKLNDEDGAINSYQEAAAEAMALPLAKRLRALKSCARKLRQLGAAQAAQTVMNILANEMKNSGDDAAAMKVVVGLFPELLEEGVSPQISQRLYELESRLDGEALVRFYMKRAEHSEGEGDRESTLRFLNMALQQANTETLIKSCLDRGLELLKGDNAFSMRLALLQHPSIPNTRQQEVLQELFGQYLKKNDYAKAEKIAELMPEEEGFVRQIALLADTVDEKADFISQRIYAKLMQRVREKPHLKMQLLEKMIGDFEYALAIHYKDDIEKMIAAMDEQGDDRGAVLYVRALQLKWEGLLTGVEKDVTRGRVSTMMPRVAGLTTAAERGRRSMIYLLFASALSTPH